MRPWRRREGRAVRGASLGSLNSVRGYERSDLADEIFLEHGTLFLGGLGGGGCGTFRGGAGLRGGGGSEAEVVASVGREAVAFAVGGVCEVALLEADGRAECGVGGGGEEEEDFGSGGVVDVVEAVADVRDEW